MTALRLCYFSATSVELPSLGAAVSAYRKLGREIAVYARTQTQLFSQAQNDNFVKNAIESDVVFLALHGGRASCPPFDQLIESVERTKQTGGRPPLFIIQSVGGDEEALLLAKEHADFFGEDHYPRINRYFTIGGPDNLLLLLKYLFKLRYQVDESIDPPNSVPAEGIYHPDLTGVQDLTEYLHQKVHRNKPTVGIWFYQGYWVNGNLANVDALIREIERQGANPLAVFSYRLKDSLLDNLGADAVVERFFKHQGQKVVDVVISVMGMSMTIAAPEYEKVLPDLDVPYLQGLVSSSPHAVWKQSAQGVSTMDVTFQAAQPEFDGALITVPVAAREEDAVDPVTGGMIARNVPIPIWST